MRTALFFLGSTLGSIAFQLSIAVWPNTFQSYGWAVKYVWILWALIWVVWALTHPKVVGGWFNMQSSPPASAGINTGVSGTQNTTAVAGGIAVGRDAYFGYPHPDRLASSEPTPSFLFAIGAPLGDNDSDTWIMFINHYGPNTAYNCKIEFFDRDRKNIEHEWLVKNPGHPFLPQGMFDASQIAFEIAEAGVEPTSASNFQWKPLDSNHQHYSANIICREGVFSETWEVTRIDGVLRSKIMVEHGPEWIRKNPGKNRIVFEYQDSDFVPSELLREIPPKAQRSVHAGWKPNHKFSVPVAIVNPNGHLQVMSGVKDSTGVTTKFGSWNLLTEHFGHEGSRPLS